METFKLYHWYKGDKYGDPGWVLSGTFACLGNAKSEMVKLRSMGWKEFRLIKITTEELDLQKLET